MALDLTLVYPGQMDTTDPVGYPFGKAKNIVNPGDGTGTPYEKQILNDTLGFHQNLLARASILVPSGTPDKAGASEYTTGVEAVATIIFKRNGVELGRIVESPEITLEEDILRIVTK